MEIIMKIKDLLLEVKWAYQRVVRGWDDRVVWSVDCWLNGIMPSILTRLQEDKLGTPSVFFADLQNVTEQDEVEARKLWQLELQKMIDGFKASQDLIDLKYDWKDPSQKDKLEKTFNEGMESFVRYYHSLWD